MLEVAAALGLATAAAYGIADFLGGRVARRARVLPVVFWMQALGAAVMAVVAPVLGGAAATSELLWGAGAGLAGGTAMAVYFRGLARAKMGVVAPIAAVVAVIVPVAVGLALGERPAPTALLGVAAAVAAVALVSLSPAAFPATEYGARAGDGNSGPDAATRLAQRAEPGAALAPPQRAVGVLDALAAGTCFGLFYVFLAQAGPAGGGLWPLLAATATSVVPVGAVALVARADLRVRVGDWPWVLASGLLGVLGTLAFLLAARRGLLALVAVLAGLSPAATVILARLFLHERLTRLQAAGLIFALLGAALISAS